MKLICTNIPPLSVGDYRVSHLIFAEDLLAVGSVDQATIPSLNLMLVTLDDYMGLFVNKDKSFIYAPGGIANQGLLLLPPLMWNMVVSL